MNIRLLHILFLFVAGFGYAQNTPQIPEIQATVDTAKIRIGEQINYQIVIKNAKVGIDLLPLQLDSLNKIEIVKDNPIDTLKDKLVKKYVLTSFDSGSYEIPAQQIYVWSQEYTTKPIKIDVATVAVDTTKQKMFPIKAIQKEPYTFDDFKQYLWWLLAVILLLLVVILYFVFRKKKTPEEKLATIPPYELALQQLQALDKKQLWQQNKIKRYYFELTDILRNYIERELHIPAMESTSNELLTTLQDFNLSSSILDIPEETILKLRKLLNEADLVKFAKYVPLANEIEIHRKYTGEILDELQPKKVEEHEAVE
ncbi:MAG: hypothetical protein CSA39_05800 [Flavobacteriales bacterium]|nr:MAG: hypothetical protein CSA39_05800 [Flavobacteriales bacterium]